MHFCIASDDFDSKHARCHPITFLACDSLHYATLPQPPAYPACLRRGPSPHHPLCLSNRPTHPPHQMLFSTCLSGVLHIRPCHCCTRVGSATWPPRPSKYGHVVWKIQAISLMVVGLFPCLPLLRTKSTSTNYTTFPSSSVVFGDILPSLSFLQLELDCDRSCGLDLTLPIPIHDQFSAYFFPIQLELDIQHSCGLDLFPSQT